MPYNFTGYIVCLIVFVQGIPDSTGCPDGWSSFGGACYLIGHGLTYSFMDAETYCQQHHSHLLEVDSGAENAFIKDLLRIYQGACYWNGLTDEISEGVWKWYNSLTYPLVTDWNPGEPNAQNGDEDCVMYYQPLGYNWVDTFCSGQCFPLCKIDPKNVVVGR